MLALLHSPPPGATAAPGPDLYRACALCDHGRPLGNRAHRCALLAPTTLTVEEARDATGPCGRDAAHLRLRGWDLQA